MESAECLDGIAPPVQSASQKMHYRISEDEHRYSVKVRLFRETQEAAISHVEVPSYFPGSKIEIILADMSNDPTNSCGCRQTFTVPSAYSTKTFEVQREYKLLSVHFPVAISPKRRRLSLLDGSTDTVNAEGTASLATKRPRMSASALTTPSPETITKSLDKSTDRNISKALMSPSPTLKKQRIRPPPGSVILTNPDMSKDNYPQLHRDIPAHRDVKFMPQRKEY